MVSFSGRPLGGTVALNIIGNPSAVHMSLFQYLATIFCWCVFPCCHCLLPVLHHNILLSNCRPILGIEWLSRHQPSHQWSESINWVLWFLFFFSMWWNRTNCNETVGFFLLHLLTSVCRLSTFIFISYLLKLGWTLKILFLSFFQTRLVPNRISRRRHSHGKEHIQGRRVCQLHGKRGINTLKFYIKMKRACSLCICAEMG